MTLLHLYIFMLSHRDVTGCQQSP